MYHGFFFIFVSSIAMQKRLILNAELLSITVDRLCQQLIENHSNFDNTVIIGLQSKGAFLADILADRLVEDKKVILVDDVLYTGRSVRAALDAMLAFGRPEKVEFLTLINRKYSRDLPIEPDYVGRDVNTIDTQVVRVEIGEGTKNKVWLVNEE